MTALEGDSSVPEQPFTPFTLGRYRVLLPLGQGGMARVYLAEQRGVAGFSRRVVIKQILEQHAANERFVKMFVDEANIAVNLQHPNVVQVLELGQEAQNLYMVLEWVDGVDLNTLFNLLVDNGQSMPVDLALYVANSVLAGLVHAHAARGPDGQPLNLIHRDITPGNVLLGRGGEVKLSDFGVARATNRMTQTVVGEVKGKYSYMAPEVMQGDAYDQRSDVFGMGVVLWEALTTRPMFRGKSDFHVMEAVLRGPLYPPSAYNPAVPPELDAVVMHALERDVSRRFESARAFRKALAPLMPKEDPDALTEKLADLVSRFAQTPPIPAAPGPQTDPGPRVPTPPPAAAPRQSAPMPASSAPVEKDWLSEALAGAPEMSESEGAAAFDALFNPPAPPSSPQFSSGGTLEKGPYLEPPAPGEPGFHAVLGAEKTPVGPISVRSAAAILQRPFGHPTDKLGISPVQMLPVPEVGRLLLMDHLVKLPVPAQQPTQFGTMRETGVVPLLLTATTGRLTGLLTLSWGPQDAVAAFLNDGHLQYTFQADPTNHLLSLFVQHQQRGLALLPQMLALVIRDRMPLPRAMAKVAQLNGARITQAVSMLARERLTKALLRDDASYAFYPGATPPYELPMNRESLLSMLPYVLSQRLHPVELGQSAARLLERPLELADNPKLATDLGMANEVQLLRQVLQQGPWLRQHWARLAPAGTPEEARWMLTVVVLKECGLLRDKTA